MDRAAPSYAVLWREADGDVNTGELALDADAVRLEGTSRQGRLRGRRIPYVELTGVEIGRAAGERIGGRPALNLTRTDGGVIHVAAMGAGILVEIADLLAAHAATAREPVTRLALIVPLRKGSGDLARTLIDDGPPFDPEAAGLERHDVLLSEDEVIFLFAGTAPREALERLVADIDVWRAALAWRRCIAGKPRVAETVYSWPANARVTAGASTSDPGVAR